MLKQLMGGLFRRAAAPANADHDKPEGEDDASPALATTEQEHNPEDEAQMTQDTNVVEIASEAVTPEPSEPTGIQSTEQDSTTETLPSLMPQGDLDRIALETKTDKSSDQHDYLRAYEWVLAPLRNKSFTLMELGVGQVVREAGSLKMWKSFFPKAQIVGVDINQRVQRFEEERITIEIGNASKHRVLRRLFEAHQPHVIIDDASHMWSHQILSLRTLFPMLPPGGIMIIEDTHTSFMPDEDKGFADAPESFYDVLARLQRMTASGHNPDVQGESWEHEIAAWIDVVALSNKTSIFVKRTEPLQRGLRNARSARKREKLAAQ